MNENFDRFESARKLYEGTHGMTITELAKQTGIPRNQLSSRRRSERWAKAQKTKDTEVTHEALAAALDLREKVTVAEQVERQTFDEIAETLQHKQLSERNELIDRHKSELRATRGMLVEALKVRDRPLDAFEKLKLAKITSETLAIIQRGERLAYGIDKPLPGSITAIVEREGTTEQVLDDD